MLLAYAVLLVKTMILKSMMDDPIEVTCFW